MVQISHLPLSKNSKFPFQIGVFFPGRSVNDILYIWESTSFVSNAVTTCNASQKRKIVEINDDDDDVEDVDSQLGSETFHLNTQPIGKPEQLTNFQFLPIGERERQLVMTSSSSPLSLRLIVPSNLSIALQINSGTSVSVMLQLLCFANFRISNRPTIRLTVSSAYEPNKPANRSFLPQAKFLTNSNEFTQIYADRSQHQRACRIYFSPFLTSIHTGAGLLQLATSPPLQSIMNFEGSSSKSRQKLS